LTAVRHLRRWSDLNMPPPRSRYARRVGVTPGECVPAWRHRLPFGSGSVARAETLASACGADLATAGNSHACVRSRSGVRMTDPLDIGQNRLRNRPSGYGRIPPMISGTNPAGRRGACIPPSRGEAAGRSDVQSARNAFRCRVLLECPPRHSPLPPCSRRALAPVRPGAFLSSASAGSASRTIDVRRSAAPQAA
jgi:hypothetical protein